MDTNLLKEILNKLEDNGKTLKDIKYITINDHDKLDIFDVLLEASTINYDSGFGGEEINTSLKIIGDDWWLERAEYDGSEWFEFKTYPKGDFIERPVTKETLLRNYDESFD